MTKAKDFKKHWEKAVCVALGLVTALTLFLGVSSLAAGFDKIENYYNAEEYSFLNENAYVGGDAYNYIINGTYFTAYSVQGMGCLLIAAITGVGALMLSVDLVRQSGTEKADDATTVGSFGIGSNPETAKETANEGEEQIAESDTQKS